MLEVIGRVLTVTALDGHQGAWLRGASLRLWLRLGLRLRDNLRGNLRARDALGTTTTGLGFGVLMNSIAVELEPPLGY